jgi:hypothetical protein
VKKLSVAVLFLAVVFVLAGCGSKSAAIDQNAVLAYAGPATDNLLAGLNAGDYVKFSRDFDAQMKSAIPETAFQQTRQSLLSKVGQYQSRTLVTIHQTGPADNPVMVVIYNGKFGKADNVSITVSFQKSGGKEQVTGLYFK